MLFSLSSILKTAKRSNCRGRHHLVPTHVSMLQEHERRKGEELHRRLAHEKRFLGIHNLVG
jgi:hypothetical protein